MSEKKTDLETGVASTSTEVSVADKVPSRASQATGPKTPAGKRRSSQNAAKHKLFSKTGLPRNVRWDKLPAAYRKLHSDLVKELKPKGACELMAVEAIASSFYRWRAAAYLQIELVAELDLDVPRETSIQEEVRDEVIRQYLASLPLKSRLGHLMGLSDDPNLRLPEEWQYPSVEITEEVLAARIRESLDLELFRERLHQAWKALPKPPDITVDPALRLREENRRTELLKEMLEKLQRYEAHLWRIFLRALHELERLQRMRLGQPVPPPIEVNLTT